MELLFHPILTTIMSPPQAPAPPTATDAAKPVTNAAHPFNKTAADAILRTSDHVDFWVRRSILAEASCVFEDMLSIPQPPPGASNADELKDGLPVIRLAEDSRTLDSLLRLCYPTDDPEFGSLDELRPVLEAAIKFMMQEATSLLRRRLVKLGQAQPLRAFAISCSLELEQEAGLLAPLAHGLLGTFVEELHNISAGAYHRLVHYQPRKPNTSPKHTRFGSPVVTPTSNKDINHHCSDGPAELIPPELLNSSTADVIIRSVDGVSFYLHSTVLSFASPVFRRMIVDNSSAGDNHRDPITLPEHSQTLAALLQHVYPLPRPAPPSSLSKLKVLLAAATKYQLSSALSALRSSLIALLPPEPPHAYISENSHKHDPKDALRIFALTHRFGFTAERTAAARALLRLPSQELRAAYVDELEDISAAVYFRLLEYHGKCGQAASACVLAHALQYTGATPSSAPASPVSSGPAASTHISNRGWTGAMNRGRAPLTTRAQSPSSPPNNGTSRPGQQSPLHLCASDLKTLTTSGPHTYQCHVVLDETSLPSWTHFRTRSAPRWWIMYVYKVAFVLRQHPSSRVVVFDRGLRRRAVARALECVCCRNAFLPGFEEYVAALAGVVEQAVGKVKLEVR
ncbi:hypothetical protein C8Q74DRAFT_1303021 [Fomes fomentarius]|nr:hypothetical protein C8Q74DRAFT_1303021 [Fomes fomentarius]